MDNIKIILVTKMSLKVTGIVKFISRGILSNVGN